MNTAISLLTIILYLLAAGIVGIRLIKQEETTGFSKRWFYLCGILAILLHGYILYQNIITIGGLNLGFYNALSLIGACISLIVLLTALFRPLENLGIIIFPVTAMAVTMELLLTSNFIFPADAPYGLKMHILLSICAYSLLSIGAFQALVLALQERQISNKNAASIMLLPPLRVMEDLLVHIIAIGFFILSLSLISGAMFVDNLLAQHLVHKTVLSILAWIIFAILLWGRWAYGWRGKQLVRWSIGGYCALLLAYFGSKFVLELVLKRV